MPKLLGPTFYGKMYAKFSYGMSKQSLVSLTTCILIRRSQNRIEARKRGFQTVNKNLKKNLQQDTSQSSLTLSLSFSLEGLRKNPASTLEEKTCSFWTVYRYPNVTAEKRAPTPVASTFSTPSIHKASKQFNECSVLIVFKDNTFERDGLEI